MALARRTFALCFAASLLPSSMAGQASTRLATLTVRSSLGACKEARLGDRPRAREADGTFVFDSVLAGPHRLTCGRTIELYVSPGARVRLTMSNSGAPTFGGRGATLNAFLQSPRDMATSRFSTLWTLSPVAFRRAWDAAHASDSRALRRAQGDADPAFIERERVRLRLRYAWGRTTYPYFHWRESEAREIESDPSLSAYIAALPLADKRWWSLPEHGALVEALVHERGRRFLTERAEFQRGDARWLRAEFEAAESMLPSSALVRQATTRLIERHLEENGSRGIDSVRGRWYALGPDAATRHRVDSVVADDRARRDGHPVAIYQTIDGVDLEVHVLRPEGADSSVVRPAMLWFHGGSGTTGAWWHSPGVVAALRRNGVTVLAVEYRTGSRFDAGPLEQMTDAASAFAWATENAERYRIDRQRIGVAGFSSGSTLALLLATRGVGSMVAPPKASGRIYPAAVVVTGACPDPAGPREDGYFRKMISRHGATSGYSPVSLIEAGQPPTLVIQATKDEYCAYDDARAFVDRSTAAGNAVELSTVDGAGHFFGFYYPPGQRQLRDAIAAALRRWNWATP